MPYQAEQRNVATAELFRTLGNPARLRILELLREGERSVGTLQAELGLDSGGTSQQLAALRRVGLVQSRREGTSVFYRLTGDDVLHLLDVARGIIGRAIEGQQTLLQELAAE